VIPRNILLDFDPSEYVDSRAGSPNGVLRIDDLCRDVTNGLFTLVANDEPYEVSGVGSLAMASPHLGVPERLPGAGSVLVRAAAYVPTGR
jgi:hypothetical protein